MFLKSITLKREMISDWSQYPLNIPTIQSLEKLEFVEPITFFVGENGSGKSTLLEAIAEQIGFNPAGGSTQNYQAYDVHAADSALADYIRLAWLPKVSNGFFLRAETFYQFATHIDTVEATNFAPYGGKSLHHQSHGESFLSLFTHRFTKERAIYLLDEPEAALSPSRQLAFLRILHDLTASGNVQFIIATHSPILLGYPQAQILQFDDHGIEEVAYEDTDHYNITRYFLNHRENMLATLFDEP